MKEYPNEDFRDYHNLDRCYRHCGARVAQAIKPATTQSECEKNAGMKWDDQTKTCVKK
jgi:hypothetical protein